MARKTIKELVEESVVLNNRLIGQENLNRRLITLLEDARDHFDIVGKNLETVLAATDTSRDVYVKVCIELQEVFRGQESRS